MAYLWKLVITLRSIFNNFKLVVGNVEDYNYLNQLSEFIQKVNENHSFEILIKN